MDLSFALGDLTLLAVAQWQSTDIAQSVDSIPAEEPTLHLFSQLFKVRSINLHISTQKISIYENL